MTTDDPLIEVIADKLWRIDGIHVTPDGPDEYHRSNAQALYAAIAATGRLLPDGGTTRVDTGVMWPSGYIERCTVADAAAKILAREQWRQGDERVGGPGLLVRRTVVAWPPVSRANAGRYTGPWEVAP